VKRKGPKVDKKEKSFGIQKEISHTSPHSLWRGRNLKVRGGTNATIPI
jgi:hypothetical protein